MDENDKAEVRRLLGSLSDAAASAASNALDGVVSAASAPRLSAGADLDWLVRAIADALKPQSSRRSSSANQIAAAVARAVQRGARFT